MRVAHSPYRSLIICFILWKVILLSIAYLSPGQGYDTSTSLLLHQSHAASETVKDTSQWLKYGLVNKLVRWDAIYFAQISSRGYVFEQEWAFGWGFTRLVSRAGKGDLNKIPCIYRGG